MSDQRAKDIFHINGAGTPPAIQRPEAVSEKRIWTSQGPIRLMKALRRDMSISKIPEILEPTDSELCGGITDPTWTDPSTREVHVRALKDVQNFFLRLGDGPDDLLGALAAISVSHDIRDDAILEVNLKHEMRSILPWKTVGEMRAFRPEVRKRLKFLITRNTSPLLMSADFMRKRIEMCSIFRPTWVNAADIQVLFDRQAGRTNFSDLDIIIGAGLVGASKFSWAEAQSQPWSEGAPSKFVLSEFAEDLLSQMHPSAHDPNFRDRFEGWVRDWPESKDSAYTWIRTWSGRLRRLQAKRHKADLAFYDTVDRLVLSHHKIAAGAHAGDTEQLIKVLAYGLGPTLGLSGTDLLAHVRASLLRTMPVSYGGDVDAAMPEVLTRLSAAGRISIGLEHSIISVRDGQDLERFRPTVEALPAEWKRGVEHTFAAYRNGGRTEYDLLTDFHEHAEGDEEVWREFVRPRAQTRFSPRSPTVHIVADMAGLPLSEAANRLAFLRGKAAGWVMVSKSPHAEQTAERVIDSAMEMVVM